MLNPTENGKCSKHNFFLYISGHNVHAILSHLKTLPFWFCPWRKTPGRCRTCPGSPWQSLGRCTSPAFPLPEEETKGIIHSCFIKEPSKLRGTYKFAEFKHCLSQVMSRLKKAATTWKKKERHKIFKNICKYTIRIYKGEKLSMKELTLTKFFM